MGVLNVNKGILLYNRLDINLILSIIFDIFLILKDYKP